MPGKTLPAQVENMAFMLDRLAADCAPLQENRELTQNAIEAIERVRGGIGEIVWDVDWPLLETTGLWKRCLIDTGDGMTGSDEVRYINHLSSSAAPQSLEGNYGVGAKITAGVQNPAGVIYSSWRESKGAMVQFWRDPETNIYGLKQLELPDGSFVHWAPLTDDAKPSNIKQHGTRVTLLGRAMEENTLLPPEGASYPTHWLTRYLNRRYFAFPEGISVKVREFSKRDPALWPTSPKAAMSEGSQLRTVHGQRHFLERHSEASGTVQLNDAVAFWWLLKEDAPRQLDLWQSTGHIAALWNSELYEMRDGPAGKRMLQTFGVLFGTSRVVIYVRPSNGDRTVTSNTARTQLLVNGELLPWDEWAAAFRNLMPDAIKRMMDEIISGATDKSHRESILQRLKSIKELFRLSRYRMNPAGVVLVDGTASGGSSSTRDDLQRDNRRGGGGVGGRAGQLYAAFIAAQGGKAANPVEARNQEPKVDWVFLANRTREPGDLEDRAARYLHEQNRILANGDFRVFTDMRDYWIKQYEGIPEAAETIGDVVREWFEQQLIESVMGVRILEGSRMWSEEDVRAALSEEALTAAVMPRYHVHAAIKRTLGQALGSLKTA